MTDAHRNVNTVERFYDAERRRDLDTWRAFWHRDGRQTFWAAGRRPPVVGRDALVAETARKFATRPPYENHVTTSALADGSVLAQLHLSADALDIEVDIWCIFRFDADGMLLEIHELVGAAADLGPSPEAT